MWKIPIEKKGTHFLEMEDNDDRKSFLDYICVEIRYVEEQRTNLKSKHMNRVLEMNTCREELLDFKQAKLNALILQHTNIEILISMK